MQILVGNDSKSTASALASAAATVAMLITGFLSVVSLQVPKFSWLWAILGAGVVCLAKIYGVIIGYKMNYIEAAPSSTTDTAMLVNVTTTGPVPTPAPADVKVQ